MHRQRFGRYKKTDRDDVAAEHDLVDPLKRAAVDVYREPPRCESGKGAADATNEFVVGRAQADSFANGQGDDVAHADGRSQREGTRARAGDGVQIERHADANHAVRFCPAPRSRLPRRVTNRHMSVFGNYGSAEVIDAAEKFINKMDERDLAAAIEQSERSMTAAGRSLLVEAIFDAFRQRGESSEDAAEGAGATLEAICGGEESAVSALLAYARQNSGLLKEAATGLIEREPHVVAQLSPALADGIAARLLDR